MVYSAIRALGLKCAWGLIFDKLKLVKKAVLIGSC